MLGDFRQQFVFRAIIAWIAIIAAESVHGALRQIFLAPLVGDFPARRIAFFTGMVLIFTIAWITARWIGANDRRALLTVGSMWAALTLVFELVLGRFVMNVSWDRILEDYDVSRGGLMAFGIIFLAIVPLIVHRLRST